MEAKMSDNFLRAAQKEVREDLEDIKTILDSCKNDSDISTNAAAIRKHLHKIKGLAPMMGEDEIGKISQMADKLVKHISTKGPQNGSYEILNESARLIEQILKGESEDTQVLKKSMKEKFPGIFTKHIK